MYKNIVYLVVLSVLNTTAAMAQQSVYEPVQVRANVLANTQNVPQNFTIFVPDTTAQILFNPARAANYSKKFVYGTYNALDFYYIKDPLSNRSSQVYYPTTVLTSLINSSNGKWLFTFENGIYQKEDEFNRNSDDQYDTVAFSGQTRNVENYDRAITRLKISYSRNTSFGGQSFGIIGMHTRFNEKDFYSQYNFSKSLWQHPKNKNIADEEKTSYWESMSQISKYVVGLTYSLSGQDWDLITLLTYQDRQSQNKDSNSQIRSRIDSTIYDEPDSSRFRHNWYKYLTKLRDDHKPKFINFTGYYRHKMGLFTDQDHIFLSLNADYSYGNTWYNSARINESFINENDEYMYAGDTLNIKTEGKYKNRFWNISVSVGYVLQKTLSEIYFFTGICPTIEYANLRDLSGTAGYYRRSFYNYYFSDELLVHKSKIIQSSLNFPFYLNYSPVYWLSVFGGFNYTYSYQYMKTESHNPETIISTGKLSKENRYEHEYGSKNTLILSDKEFFMGATLRHKSGIVAHFACNGDFAGFSRWNVTIGYHF